MIFKDRKEAGEKLANELIKNQEIKNNIDKIIIISLLRGGIIVGNAIAEKLSIKHLPLVVTKISSPHNPELAIGAICFNITHLEKVVINSLNVDKKDIAYQISLAQNKFNSYVNRFNINKKIYDQLKNKIIIITDDGVATGSTIKAAFLFIKGYCPKRVYLASPVASNNFYEEFDNSYIVDKSSSFSSISQSYLDFPQIDDEEVLKIISNYSNS